MIRHISTKWLLAVLATVVVPFIGFAWYVDIKLAHRLSWDVVHYFLLSRSADLAEQINFEVSQNAKDVERWAGDALVAWSIGEAKGLKQIGMSCDSPSDYATVKPIRKIADFKGQKIRVFGSRFEIETLRRLGGTGVPMPLSEVVPAIQQKVIDGNRSGIVVFVPFKYQTIAPYVLQAKESIICITKFASKVWFDKLPGDLQRIILEEAADADRRILAFSIALVDKFYKIWTKTGGTLTQLSPEEQAEMRRRLSTVGEAVLKDRPKVMKVYKIMKAAAERTRRK